MDRFPIRRSATGALVFLLLGPITWSVHFFVLYTGHASICALTGGAGTGWIKIIIVGVTALCLAALAAIMIQARPLYRRLTGHQGEDEEAAFLVTGTRVMSFLSLLGVVWAGATVLIVPICAQLR
jgi:hypothetical protein